MFYGAHCSNARAQWQLPRCPNLNYFGIVPVSLASVVPIWFAQLVSLLMGAIHAGNAFIVFCCCRLLECAVISVRYRAGPSAWGRQITGRTDNFSVGRSSRPTGFCVIPAFDIVTVRRPGADNYWPGPITLAVVGLSAVTDVFRSSSAVYPSISAI